MKAIKISLAVIVVAAIAFFVIQSLVITDKTGGISLPQNQFTKRIKQETDSLGTFPNNKFCKEFYEEVNYHIEDYYKNQRLGNSPSENNQWKDNLSQNLYSVYAEKFIHQAFYVFSSSVWKIEDLKFIRSEYQTLRKSNLLEKGSPVDKKFTEIQTIFSKYDEITGFISACRGFSYSGSSLFDKFPLTDAKSKISRAKTLQNNGLGNEYVNNCTRLHDGLKEIPQTLFRAHVRYLDNKISYWSGKYSEYNSQSEYANLLYTPLKSEIENLNDRSEERRVGKECRSRWSPYH